MGDECRVAVSNSEGRASPDLARAPPGFESLHDEEEGGKELPRNHRIGWVWTADLGEQDHTTDRDLNQPVYVPVLLFQMDAGIGNEQEHINCGNRSPKGKGSLPLELSRDNFMERKSPVKRTGLALLGSPCCTESIIVFTPTPQAPPVSGLG
jgi:hypothetical protein